jgi:hypothetical protein
MGLVGRFLGHVLVVVGCLVALNFGGKSHVQVVVEPAIPES